MLWIVTVGLALSSGSRMWANAKASASEDFNIYLASSSFDPAANVPPAPGGLAMTSEQTAPGTYSWQVRANKTSDSTEANSGTRWTFLEGPPYQVFLPLVVKNASTAPGGIVTGDFEAGSTGWTEYSLQGY